MKKSLFNFALILMMAIFILGSCTKPTPAPPQAEEPQKTAATITIAAAANLKDVLTEIQSAYEQKTKNKLKITYGASGDISQQIINGAPIDVFAAADTENIDKLIEKDLIDSKSAKDYAIGKLVLVSSKKIPSEVTTLEDLMKSEIKYIAIANPETAPYGKAAVEALTNAKLWERVKDKAVYGKNISETLIYVETNNAEVAFAPLSLVINKEYKYFEIDKNLYEPIKQKVGIVKKSENQETALDFVNFLTGDEGQEFFKKFGYDLP